MKNLRKLCAATTLLIVLSVSASAGEIHTDFVPPPPPPPVPATATATSGVITGGTQSPSESDNVIAEITLAIWQLLTVL